MYWLWKWLESYNNCTFSTWKDIFVFSLLFWIPNSFCTFHNYGRGGTPFLASPDGPSQIFYHSDFWTTFLPWKTELPWNFSLCWNIFYLSELLSNLCLPWKTECALNSLYWIYIFNHSEFRTTCACPGKQSLPWNFSLHWNICYLLGFLRNLRLPWKQSLSWNFTLYLIYFLHLGCLSRICPDIFHCIKYSFYIQDVWATCVCPENRVCLNSLYLIYIFYHSEFWTTCACPEKQNLPWNFSLYWNIFCLSGFLSNLSLPCKQSLLWIFQAGGAAAPPRLVRPWD